MSAGVVYFVNFNVMDKKVLTAAVAAAALLASCSGTPRFLGEWTSSAPMPMQDVIPAASRATAVYTIDFSRGTARDSGPLLLSASIDATQPVTGGTVTQQAYEVSVAASAAVSGTWTRHDDDELLLSFDLSTLDVTVDPAGVTFSRDMLTGMQQPAVDSLSATAAAAWEAQITAAMRDRLATFSTLDDVEVTADRNILRFETKTRDGHDVDHVMRRATVAR